MISKALADLIEMEVAAATDKVGAIEDIRDLLHKLSPQKAMPVDRVRWVPIGKVVSNTYNPNSVAKVEMRLLHTSIKADGYTQPIVVIWDHETNSYCIVDGFHRFFTMKTNKDIYDACNGLLPVVVLAKGMNDRMASTVRHNRARGKHSVQGMSSMVFSMLAGGWTDSEVCNELGMSPEEILRLKHITGFSKLFQDHEYQKSWLSSRQIKIQQDYKAGEAAKEIPEAR